MDVMKGGMCVSGGSTPGFNSDWAIARRGGFPERRSISCNLHQPTTHSESFQHDRRDFVCPVLYKEQRGPCYDFGGGRGFKVIRRKYKKTHSCFKDFIEQEYI